MFNRNKAFRVNRRRQKNRFIPALLLILVALLIALLAAVAWQLSAEKEPEQNKASSKSVPPTSQSSTQAAASSSEAPLPVVPMKFEAAVPVSERAQSVYFDDAVFVGDSITTGIELYGVMSNTHVIAETGANLATIYTKEAIKQADGTRATIMDTLSKTPYRKVYVMLGGNEVRDEEKAVFIKRYSQVIDDIRTAQPDATLYIQSILPVTKVNNYKMSNPRIDEFNEALLKLCTEKKVYFLNVAECMKDENGMLPDAASPADGMHFGPAYYNKWFEYLKTHTVGQDNKSSSAGSTSAAVA